MAQTIKERLMLFIQANGLSQFSFSEICGLSSGYMNNLKDAMHASTAKKICDKFPELSRTWLLTGEGNMYASHKSIQPKEAEDFYKMLDEQKKRIESLEGKIDLLLQKIK